jgi:hypothetical protein
MTSEKHLALFHTAFWNTLLPLEESYMRTHNLTLREFTSPLASSEPSDQHGIINEVAFRIFATACVAGDTSVNLSEQSILNCSVDAYQHIRRQRQFSRAPIVPISDGGTREAVKLATRLMDFFTASGKATLKPRPLFTGCGWVDEAEGDVLADTNLCEIKAGDRRFRGTDLRQILVYAALNFSAKTYQIDAFTLINPRLGVYFEDDLESMARKTSGASSSQILGELVYYISEPMSQDKTS